jgi:hypothetical protein
MLSILLGLQQSLINHRTQWNYQIFLVSIVVYKSVPTAVVLPTSHELGKVDGYDSEEWTWIFKT